MSTIDLSSLPVVQSPYTYLQAAGSDGADRTVKGIHLRWDFLRTLGDNHLAKGDYTLTTPYVSETGFNREDDFIRICRTGFVTKYFITINFDVNETTEVNTGTLRAWQYSLPVDSLSGVTRDVTVRFTDYTQYDAIIASQSTFDTIDLLTQYTGIVEIETDGKLFFYAKFNGTLTAKDSYVRAESVTVPDSLDYAQKQVSCRKKFVGTVDKIVSCDNIQYLRFDYNMVSWKDIQIYCYEDYIAGINEEDAWDEVGKFALTTDDAVIGPRFIPAQVDGASGHWPKFNDDNPLTGEFTVNKLNYQKRWRRPGFSFDKDNPSSNDFNGLQHFVHTYMELSASDERALASIPSDDSADPTTQDISYLDMIRLMSLDYHVARILGLGHIDQLTRLKNPPYIYCLEYKTFIGLEPPLNSKDERTHIYMTTPVSPTDYRLPAAPQLAPVTYGISVDNGTPTPTLLTDADGYAAFGDIRFVNINRGPFNFERPFGPFYYDTTEFCLCEETQPVAYGLEYREISEAGYRKPEICHDSEYLDVSGMPETVPILEGGTPKIFTHQEVEEGTHEYSAYAINWFSRVSPLSDPVEVVTEFPKHANLLPPFNFAVQLIQDEDPAEPVISEKALILTTQAEQNILSMIPTSSDKTLVRTTFDWNHVHHHAHQYADYADIFFRRPEPLIVKGKISAVTVLPQHMAEIETTSYTISSTFPVTTVTPAISPADAGKFVGSFFSSGGNNYLIENVSSTGVNPTFTVRQLKEIVASADDLHPGQFVSNETFESPVVGDLFFTAENMGAAANWDLRMTKRIYLEKFYSNAKVSLRFSPTRVKQFDIKSVAYSGGNTTIVVEKPIDTSLISGMALEYSVKHEITAVGSGTFTIAGNLTSDFTVGKMFRVFANKDNDGAYTVNSSSFSGGNTIITVSGAIPNVANDDGLLEIVVSRAISSINAVTNSFVIAGNMVSEIDAAYLEYKTESDGTMSRFVVGGIKDMVDFEPILTTPAPGSGVLPEGTGYIQLKFQNYDLLPHPDPEVTWYKGTVRLRDAALNMQVYPVSYIGNLSSSSAPHLAIVIQDPGFVPASAGSGSDFYTLNLGTAQEANFHPGYRLYLTADNGVDPVTGTPLAGSARNFDSNEILPVFSDINEGSRQTYMSVRSYDVKNELESFLSNPVVLLAQKIMIPLAPDPPQGPLYATRPDFYGKSTYTFDTRLDTATIPGRVPYSVVFYRTSEDRVLDVLYKKDTKQALLDALDALGTAVKHDPQLWNILFGVQTDTAENASTSNGPDFVTYSTTAGTFNWPLPDNDTITLTYESNKALSTTNPPPSGALVFPFSNSSFIFKFDTPAYTIYGKPWTPHQIVRRVLQDAFLSMTEQAPMFSYFKTGTVTSSVKAKSRDASGNLLDPLTNDIFPMIRKLPGSGDTVIRFTDYTLDGASKSLYFYRAVEMDDKFKFSPASLPVGPVLMVNAFPPDKPQIRKLLTKLRDINTNTPSSVLFEINEYSANEKISKVEIYRATSEIEALSIRTMKKAKSLTWGSPLVDDFSDVPFPLYGETLYYRIIAIREVEDVKDVLLAPAPMPGDPVPTVIVDLPSLPSEISRAGIVDVVNPPAPRLYSENGTTTSTELQDVILRWDPTCYNGTYRLQKLNSSGNWVQIYSVKVTDAPMQYPPLDINSLPDFANFPETETLQRFDEDGKPIYHRFRVQVENSSGLFNLSEFELTLAKGCSDLQEIESRLSFSDDNGHSFAVLSSQEIVTGANQPGKLIFSNIVAPLPAGHNTLVSIAVTVKDDLDNTQTLSVSPGGTVTFDSVTAPALDLTGPNRIYTITTKMYTDACSAGAVQKFTINYLAGPCYDLRQVSTLLKLTDSNHDIDPLVSGNVNNGVSAPVQLQLTRIDDFPSGMTFNHIDITVTDNTGAFATKTMNPADTDVTFTNADGIDLTSPNGSYVITANVVTDECTAGNEVTYNIAYTYTPCDDLTTLTGIAKYTDANGTVLDPVSSQTVTATHANGSITLQDKIGLVLPSGHSFDRMDVILEDDLGGAFIKNTGTSAGGSVTFNHGEGGLALNSSSLHRTYFVTFVLYTSACSNGSSYSFTIRYA
ncbi:MAG: hypothetical protein JWO09_2294 [Bacteroidetes bacterium]|nr:hypothetical protein [Bacteroidota bacterium]